jgi:hypothetical protein
MKMTKAQARKRLIESQNKIQAVYMATTGGRNGLRLAIVSTQDMVAIEKIITKCLKRLQ